MNEAHSKSVTIERRLTAPIALVWKMWTDPVHFANWYGPKGAVITVKAMDVRVGGARVVGMSFNSPNGAMTMWFAGEHQEVTAPTRLVYSEYTSDEDGTPVPQPGMDTLSDATEVQVQLRESDGAVHLKVTHLGVPADSPGAMGWNMALDKLDGYVTDLS